MAFFRGKSGGSGPGLAELRAYWEALRDGAALPRRDQVDPRGIAGVLERAFLIERIAPGLARIRLAGAGLAHMLGMDLRGMPLSALFVPEARMRLAAALEPVFAGPAILDAAVSGEAGWGRAGFLAEMLVLPLGEAGVVDCAIGAVSLPDDTGRAPRRLVLERASSARVEGVAPHVVAPLPFPAPSARRRAPDLSAPAFAEPPVPWRAPPGRGHLRLVKND